MYWCFSVSYDSRKLKLYITAEAQSEVGIFTDGELRDFSDLSGPAYDASNLMSANEVPGNYTTQSETGPRFKSGIVDLRRYHNVYISSGSLSSFKTLGPRGESNTIQNYPLRHNMVLH